MKTGDKVRVVNNSKVYSTYDEMAEIMGLTKFNPTYNCTRAPMNGSILTVLAMQNHPCNAQGLLIGVYCEHLDEDFIINIKGVEAIEYKEGKQ